MKTLIVSIILLLCSGCDMELRRARVQIIEHKGLECAQVSISTGGGLSCNWDKYNQEH